MRTIEEEDDEFPEDGNLKMAVGAMNTRKKMIYSRKVFAVISAIFLIFAIGNMTLFITPGVREFVQQYRILVYLCTPLPIVSKLLITFVERISSINRPSLLLIPVFILHLLAIFLSFTALSLFFDTEIVYFSCFIIFMNTSSYITRKNYYEIIGVPATATRLEIRDAFLAKTKQLHPDQSSSQNSKKDSRVGWRTGASETEQFMLVKEAYDVLRNEEKRKEYDMATSREGGFLMEATLKTQQMSTQRRNIQRAEWSADVIPDARKKSKTTVYSHFRNPEEEYLKEKRKNRLLGVLAATVMALIAANILYIRRLQARRLLEDSQPVR
ncbi:hypothetical protein GCK72_017362 [Caenorhabditis remanei]|uniref:J domain-containing protein n=1 Tax=Caenorhabditis remanei TaxID=31234 RepID=A0A6A5G7V4_CAERE|nr:hypothetical protein GCK72_017362 [Caenorhabditis remanei]KAF1750811.1 hypothetical protein GCK72_017362 [Caenorhabditis remanei]